MRHMVECVCVCALGLHVEIFETYPRYSKYEYVNKYNVNDGSATETEQHNVEQHGINDSKLYLPSFFLFSRSLIDGEYDENRALLILRFAVHFS